ncbi:MAG: hypothetical protein ACTSXP_06585, partial [Promethearchaeota archaeon]
LKKKRYSANLSYDPYTPMVENLINDCLAKFHAQKGYDKENIINAIKNLEEKRWIVTAERRTRNEIIKSELYRRILAFLKAYPGTHARDGRIQEKLGITRNPFLKHMLVLERFDMIRKVKSGKIWAFFLPSFDGDENIEKLVILLYNDTCKQIVKILLDHPEYNLQTIAEHVIPPVFHGTVQYHIKKLEEIGFIQRKNNLRIINKEMLEEYNRLVCKDLKIQ